ncbi:hypothetical protein [Cryobacterium sp. 10C3]|uniref:primosomal protein N' family DNA-binding protein n=1 Tax=Cryobacterium sp. 10C3 TaxID=3048577 RepID=UPI002AB4A848|nr:hypothetical protein [Cryobacterium sp. 10C3]MDY7556342.1 hypothetical protein [Cryobacterium sp. 10C3]
MGRTGLVARVLIESTLPQLDHLFDYGIPDDLAAAARPGVRVRVPLRSAGRVADGYLIEVLDAGGAVLATLNAPVSGIEPPKDAAADFHGALSPVEAIVSAAPVLTAEVWRLARRVADRAAGNASDVLRLAIPLALCGSRRPGSPRRTKPRRTKPNLLRKPNPRHPPVSLTTRPVCSTRPWPSRGASAWPPYPPSSPCRTGAPSATGPPRWPNSPRQPFGAGEAPSSAFPTTATRTSSRPPSMPARPREP